MEGAAGGQGGGDQGQGPLWRAVWRRSEDARCPCWCCCCGFNACYRCWQQASRGASRCACFNSPCCSSCRRSCSSAGPPPQGQRRGRLLAAPARQEQLLRLRFRWRRRPCGSCGSPHRIGRQRQRQWRHCICCPCGHVTDFLGLQGRGRLHVLLRWGRRQQQQQRSQTCRCCWQLIRCRRQARCSLIGSPSGCLLWFISWHGRGRLGRRRCPASPGEAAVRPRRQGQGQASRRQRRGVGPHVSRCSRSCSACNQHQHEHQLRLTPEFDSGAVPPPVIHSAASSSRY